MNAQKYTEANINGEGVCIWHPQGQLGYCISLSSGGWLTGTYDSIESAKLGAKHDLLMTPKFYLMQKKVNHIDKENRLITVDDFKGLERG